MRTPSETDNQFAQRPQHAPARLQARVFHRSITVNGKREVLRVRRERAYTPLDVKNPNKVLRRMVYSVTPLTRSFRNKADSKAFILSGLATKKFTTLRCSRLAIYTTKEVGQQFCHKIRYSAEDRCSSISIAVQNSTEMWMEKITLLIIANTPLNATSTGR